MFRGYGIFEKDDKSSSEVQLITGQISKWIKQKWKTRCKKSQNIKKDQRICMCTVTVSSQDTVHTEVEKHNQEDT